MLTIAIIGAKGMLGTDFLPLAKKESFEIIPYDLPDFDITKKDDIKRAVDSADIIANFAAFTNVDAAEKQREHCFAVNAVAPGILSDECYKKGKYLLHISTDFVFGDVSSRPLKEDTPPAPLNFYGYSKLEGEKYVLQSNTDAAIIRLEWTYGHGGKNFITKILQSAEKKKALKVVDDQYGSPTWTSDAASAMIDLIKKYPKGIFHYAPRGYTSRYKLAKIAIEYLKINTRIEPCKSSDFESLAKRPLNSRFDCSKIDGILSFPRPDWKNSLFKYLSQIQSRGTK